jgi:TP901-1 family phage major tail protein
MTAFTGRDVLVEYAIADENASMGSLVYKRLGMMRGKSVKTSWDTVDTTADQSPGFTKTSLVTFKSVEFTGDGVSYDDAVFNQNEFKAHVISPGTTTANQPKAWIRMTDPDGGKYEGPFIVSEWSDDRPYSDAATWSMSASSNGNVSFVPG